MFDIFQGLFTVKFVCFFLNLYINTASHEPLGSVILLWFDCGSLYRIIYSQDKRKAEGAMNQRQTCGNICVAVKMEKKNVSWRARDLKGLII